MRLPHALVCEVITLGPLFLVDIIISSCSCYAFISIWLTNISTLQRYYISLFYHRKNCISEKYISFCGFVSRVFRQICICSVCKNPRQTRIKVICIAIWIRTNHIRFHHFGIFPFAISMKMEKENYIIVICYFVEWKWSEIKWNSPWIDAMK